MSALRDASWQPRQAAAEILSQFDDPWLVDDLLPLASDEDSNVRCMAIRALAKFDDMRVASELFSSLNDADNDVRESAEEILHGRRGPVPVLARFAQEPGQEAVWGQLQTRVRRVYRWASRVGHEVLGRPVIVHQYRQGIGRTRAARRKAAVEIEVSDKPVTSGHPHGEEIMQAIALHEIGHHLCDIGVRGQRTMRGIARSEGVSGYFEILLDERLERALRSRRPEFGVYFDRLASYAFSQRIHTVPLEDYAKLCGRSPDEATKAVQHGELPGFLQPPKKAGDEPTIGLRDRHMLGIPGLLPPMTAFLWCLRCGFDPKLSADPRIAQAVAMVPRSLKDLPHSEVLKLARQLGDLLGREEANKQAGDYLRRLMRRHRKALGQLRRMLSQQAVTGQLPGWAPPGASGVRQTSPIGPETPAASRKPPRRLVIYKPGGRQRKLPGGQAINLNPGRDFEPLAHTVPLAFDAARHAALVAGIRKHIRRLRAYLERLGLQTVEEYASRRGRRLDLARARQTAIRPDPNVLVHSHDEIRPDAYIGVLIDRSGSMDGEKLELAKRFGALLAESARGIRGIRGHVNAFDDDTFYPLGDLNRNAIATLESGGGNNDAGGLAQAAEMALLSGKRNRMVIMVSDGHPTECSIEALRALVTRLTRNNDIVAVQVAVQTLPHVTFPHHVDLSECGMDEAVSRFGRLVMRLTASWR
jgi:hypothetical protein